MYRLLCASLVLVLGGCTTPWRHADYPEPSHAFIDYWPPAEHDTRLRLAVKDLIDMKGVVTSAGSEFLYKTSKPAERDAKCLAAARQRNVVIVGKTNTTELAVVVSGMNEYFGTPRNPLGRRQNLVPGGSSCGSAVAVARGMADVAFGTDTAGSIRVPAACCGVYGLKTTFGLVPIEGVYPIAPNQLDTVGPMAKDLPHLVEGMDLLQPGFAAEYRRVSAAAPRASRIRVGRLYLAGTDPKVDEAVDRALAATGFTVVKMDDVFRDKWIQAQKDAATIAAVCAWVYDEKFRHESGVTYRTKVVVALGQLEYHTAYKDALRRQAQWQKEMAATLKAVDFIALPTLQTLPPAIPFLRGTIAFEQHFLGKQNTAGVNLAGVPALAIPVPIDNPDIPLTSLQLVGPRRGEAALINAARLIEQARPAS